MIKKMRACCGTNPWRFLCDYGHWHPSYGHALKCHQRRRLAETKKGFDKPDTRGKVTV